VQVFNILKSFKMSLDTRGNQPLFKWTDEGLSSFQLEVTAWVTKEKGFHQTVESREKAWLRNVQPSVIKPHGVSPKSYDGVYSWADEGANNVSVDEYTALYHEQFVIDAYAKAEGRCFWLLVTEKMKRKTSQAQAKTITPTIVKARVMITLETLFDDQSDDFRAMSKAYVLEMQDNARQHVPSREQVIRTATSGDCC
jgi:hypothetical protein